MELIKDIRETNKLTQTQMAIMLQVSQGLLSSIESGRLRPSAKVLLKIRARLKLTRDQAGSIKRLMVI